MTNEYENDTNKDVLEKVAAKLSMALTVRINVDDSVGDYHDNIDVHTQSCIDALHGLHELLIRTTNDLENFTR